MLVYKGDFNEDMLTACTFGLLKYLPPEMLLNPLLKVIFSSEMDVQYSNLDIIFWASYEVPSEWQNYFANPFEGKEEPPKATIIPDVVLESDQWVIFIEAEKGHKIEAEQLFQQYAIGCRELENRNFYLLLVNGALSRPQRCEMSGKLKKTGTKIDRDDSPEEYILERGKGLSLDWAALKDAKENLKKTLLWCNWAVFYELAENVLSENALKEKPDVHISNLFEDLKALLERVGETPIKWLEDDFNIKYTCNSDLIPILALIPPLLETANIDFSLIPSIREIPDISVITAYQIQLEMIPILKEKERNNERKIK